MYKEVKKPLILFGALLYPLYALPWIIKSMVKNKFFGYFLFSFFMAYLAYLWIPYDSYDLTRHYERFIEVSSFSFEEVFNLTDKRFFFDVYMWIVSEVGFSKEFIPFSMIFFTYLLLFLTLKKVMDYRYYVNNKISHKSLMFIGISLLLLQINFVYSASGMRNYIAISIFVYSVFIYYIENRKFLSGVLMILSILFHIALLPIVLLFILSNFVSFKKLYRIVFILSLFILFAGQADKLFILFMDVVSPLLKSYGLFVDAYMTTTGGYAGGYYEHMNFKTYILEKVILPAPFYLAGIYLLLYKKIVFEKIHTFLYILFIFIVIVSFSRTIYMRYLYLFDILFIFMLLFELKNLFLTKQKKLFLAVLIGFMLLGSMGTFYASKDSYIKSWLKILYIPAPFIFLNDIKPSEYLHRGN